MHLWRNYKNYKNKGEPFMKHVFILGKELFCGYNTTVCSIIDSLAKKSSNPNIKYYVSCLAYKKRFMPSNVNNTTFFGVRVPKFGYFSYLIYDILSMYKTFKYIKKHSLSNCTILLCSSRIGIFLPLFKYKLKQYNTSLFIYCKQTTQTDMLTFFTDKILYLSQYFCIKYSNLLLSTSDELTSYFRNKYLSLNPSIVTITCDLSTFDGEFCSFLKQFDCNTYDYYLIIGEFSQFSNLYNVLTWFNKCTTPKKLIVLSRKDSSSYKKAMYFSELYNDKRILILNTSRFEHLIFHLVKYCHAFIHYNLLGIKKNFYKYNLDTINLVMDSPFNHNLKLPNILYFDQKNFTHIIQQVDALDNFKKAPNLDTYDTKISHLVQTIENLF